MPLYSKTQLKDFFNTGEIITEANLFSMIDTMVVEGGNDGSTVGAIQVGSGATASVIGSVQFSAGTNDLEYSLRVKDSPRLCGNGTPSVPANGDMWIDSGSVYVRSSSVSIQFDAPLPFSYTARSTDTIATLHPESSTTITIPSRDTWLYDMHLLSVEDTYAVARWHFKFAVQNTGAILALVGQIQGDSANFDEGESITADYTEFNGVVKIYASQPDTLLIEVSNNDNLPVDWSASGTVVKISKPAPSGSSGSS